MSGKLIVIESGTDGSGKATQANVLCENLIRLGHNVKKITFPNYESQSSALVKMYLGGEFGKNPDDVSAFASSSFYAVDRYASYKKEWEDFYNNGGIIIADRYTTSNMVHQGSKIFDEREKEEYLDWLCDLEFVKLGIPKPDMVVFLDVPLNVAEDLIKDRLNKFSGEKEKDIHESDRDYLSRSYENSQFLLNKFGWQRIDCTENNKMKTIESISMEVLEKVVEII